MEENKKNNVPSNNYKDYKYEYTGYKDYLNNHKLNKEDIEDDIKKEKESIDHDHNYVFDFNNPNEHQHDYSFDFNNPNEHQHDYSFDFSQKPQPPQPPQPTIQNRDYGLKTNTNYNNQPVYTNTTTASNKNNGLVTLAIFCIFLVIWLFILTIGPALLEEENESSNNQDKILEPINAYCNALNRENPNLLINYIYDSSNFNKWKNSIETYNIMGYNTCTTKSLHKIDEYSLEDLNEYHYNNKKKMSQAYSVKVTIVDDNNYDSYASIIVGKINNKWYLIQQDY